MVFKRDKKGGGWHEPPYTWEEEMEFYRRVNAGPMTVFRGPRPADKQEPAQQSKGPAGQAAPKLDSEG